MREEIGVSEASVACARASHGAEHRREIPEEALGHGAAQLDLVRRRKAEPGASSRAVAKRRTLRSRQREIEGAATGVVHSR